MKKILFFLLPLALLACSSKPALNNPKPPIEIRFYLIDDLKQKESLTLKNEKGELFYLIPSPFITESDITSAKITSGIFRRYDILLDFSPQGTDRLAQITKINLNKRIAIVIDGLIVMTPLILHEINIGKAMITGNPDENVTKEIVKKINTLINKN